MSPFNHPGPRTYVYKISGKNRGRVGYVRGLLSDRLSNIAINAKCFVYFPQLTFPYDMQVAPLKSLIEATPLQMIMEGFEP